MIVGHSLGAGVASALAVLLRPQYPGLVCYAMSPPGCVFRYVQGNCITDSMNCMYVFFPQWQEQQHSRCMKCADYFLIILLIWFKTFS